MLDGSEGCGPGDGIPLSKGVLLRLGLQLRRTSLHACAPARRTKDKHHREHPASRQNDNVVVNRIVRGSMKSNRL
jgi:hypothetical protein